MIRLRMARKAAVGSLDAACSLHEALLPDYGGTAGGAAMQDFDNRVDEAFKEATNV